MHSHPVDTPFTEVKRALALHDAGAAGVPLVEVLARSGATSAAFWTEVAAELHRRDLHLDAFDCWQRALLLDGDAVDREDMGDTLWQVSQGEGFLAEKALQTYEAIGAWQDVAYVRFKLNHEKASILSAIESALENCPSSLDWEASWGFDEFFNIWGWYALGHYYLEQPDESRAIRAFGKALAAEPGDLDLVISVSNTLVEYVRSKSSASEALYLPPDRR